MGIIIKDLGLLINAMLIATPPLLLAAGRRLLPCLRTAKKERIFRLPPTFLCAL